MPRSGPAVSTVGASLSASVEAGLWRRLPGLGRRPPRRPPRRLRRRRCSRLRRRRPRRRRRGASTAVHADASSGSRVPAVHSRARAVLTVSSRFQVLRGSMRQVPPRAPDLCEPLEPPGPRASRTSGTLWTSTAARPQFRRARRPGAPASRHVPPGAARARARRRATESACSRASPSRR